MKEYKIHVNVNGDEYLTTIQVKCAYFEIVDNRTVIADGVNITFKEDIDSIFLNGINIWTSNKV